VKETLSTPEADEFGSRLAVRPLAGRACDGQLGASSGAELPLSPEEGTAAAERFSTIGARHIETLRTASQLVDKIKAAWRDKLEPPDALKAFAQHPELACNKSLAVDLAAEEYRRRTQAGEELDCNQYSLRFPNFRSSIVRGVVAVRAAGDGALDLDLSTSRWPHPGAELLGFQLIDELGRGSFSRVFLAHQPALDRLVAVKFSQFAQSEARTHGKLSHPNVVPIHSVQQSPELGLSAICMEYLGSATLADVLDLLNAPGPKHKLDAPASAYAPPYALAGASSLSTRPIEQAARSPFIPGSTATPPSPSPRPNRKQPQRASVIIEAVRRAAFEGFAPQAEEPIDPVLQRGTFIEGVLHLIIQLADALAYTHSRQVLHLDLKPSNVLLTRSGRPLLTDFNLSYDPAAPSGRHGGTLPYMSPEQLREVLDESEAPLDGRSDIFSLGVVLYELVTGEMPFVPARWNLVPEVVARHLLDLQRQGPKMLCGMEGDGSGSQAGDVSPSAHVVAALAPIILRCLAFDREDRFQSALDLAVALRALTHEHKEALRRARRRKFVWGAVAAATLAGGVSVATFLAGRESFGRRQYLAGREHARAGDYRAALQCYERGLESEPSDWDLRYARALALAKLKQFDAALQAFHELRGDQQAIGKILACMGYCFSELGRHRESLERSWEAHLAGVSTPALWNNMGFNFLRLVRNVEAHAKFTQAIFEDPKCSTAYLGRAVVAIRRAQAENQPSPAWEGMNDAETALQLGQTAGSAFQIAASLAGILSSADPRMSDHAMELAAAAIDRGMPPWLLTVDPVFATLTNHPRFSELAARPRTATQLYRAQVFLDPIHSE
jgi:serine/threonine protein kinase